MGRRKRLATVSVDHGRLAVVEFNRAVADGIIDLTEQRRLRNRIDGWFKASLATDVSQALGNGLERGIGDPVYLKRLVDAYQLHVDELDPIEAA